MKHTTDAHSAHKTPQLGIIFDYIFTQFAMQIVSSIKARKNTHLPDLTLDHGKTVLMYLTAHHRPVSFARKVHI